MLQTEVKKKEIKEGNRLLSQAQASTKALVLSFARLQTCFVRIAGTDSPTKLTNECELEPTSRVSKENSACGQLS